MVSFLFYFCKLVLPFLFDSVCRYWFYLQHKFTPMRERFLFLVRYFIFWLAFFFVARLLFMFYSYQQSFSIPFGEWLGIFSHGVWMDASQTGYVTLLVALTIGVLYFASERVVRVTTSAITLVLLTLSSIIIISDLELYRNWGYRIDATPLLYLKTPGEAFASVKPWMIVVLVAACIAFVAASYWVYRKLVWRKGFARGKWWLLPLFTFVAATMIIPIRGGFGIAPMNPGKVFFSHNVYSNHAALNAVWNMIYSYYKSGSMYKKYPDYVDKNTAKARFQDLMAQPADSVTVLKTQRPNVVVILLEGFTAKMIEPLGGLSDVTPQFNALTREGILFSKMFASGDRSDKGIVATLSGFPAQSTESIIKYQLKSSKLPTISADLFSQGYSTAFYYGGDPDFANIRSYLFGAKFQRIVTQDDFPRSYRNSKWGVHDEHVFKRLLTDIDSARGPFFKFFFTLSSHEPFEIPTAPKFSGSDEDSQFKSAAYYADSCLGQFFSEAKTREWYKNTLFVLIADHGVRYLSKHPNYAPERFKIPMLWLGGALAVEPKVVEHTSSQIDLAATLLTQMGMETSEYRFSKDLFGQPSVPFAYYVFNDGFGFMTDSSKFIYDHTGKRVIVQEGNNPDMVANDAFSFFSVYQEYFLGL